MTQDQLRLQLAQAVEYHARTLQDHGGRAGPALIDDLVAIAVRHAEDHARNVTNRIGLREAAAVPIPAPAEDGTPAAAGSHRTRNRTRGGAPA